MTTTDTLAEQLLDDCGIAAPADAFAVAECLGLTIVHGSQACISCEQQLVYLPSTMRPERRQFQLAHEIGHYILRLHGIEDTESRCNRFASALLLPRRDFLASLRRHGWQIAWLKQQWPRVSHEAIGRRICALRRDATMWMLDQPPKGDVRRSRVGKKKRLEGDVLQAFEAATHVRDQFEAEGVSVCVVNEAGWRRVFAVG
jgi:hypothetical protein